MRALTWIVGIAALAVVLTLAARYNTGYVLMVVPPYRAEISLNFLVVLLVAAFAGAYALLRLVAATARLPAQARAFRQARREEKARAELHEALCEFFAGRYGRAEQLAVAASESGAHPVLAAVVAARAAHELRAHERRDAALARAAAASAGDDPVHLVTAAEFLIDERRYEQALDVLRRLPRRHTAALRLELRAQQQLRNWERVMGLAEDLRRRNVFDATQADQLRRYALVETLRRKASDAAALEEAWGRITPADRKNRRVAAAAAECFSALGACDKAHRIIDDALEAEWDSDLLRLYAECEGPDVVKRIERAESWLKEHPRDAALLRALGRLCAESGLWGKAQSYLEASAAVEPSYSTHLALGRLHERLGNPDSARNHYRESLDLALALLSNKEIANRK